MTQMIFVGSKSQGTVVPVEGTGLSQIEARRAAIQFARARYRIADPIALNEHEAAVRMRRQFIAQFTPQMPNLNGHSPMCFDNKYYLN